MILPSNLILNLLFLESSIRFQSLLSAACIDGTESAFRTHTVAKSTKGEHSHNDRDANGDGDDKSKRLEENEGSSEEEGTAAKSGKASTEDTDSHLSV